MIGGRSNYPTRETGAIVKLMGFGHKKDLTSQDLWAGGTFTLILVSMPALLFYLFIYLFILLQNHTHIRYMVYNIDIQ